MNGKITDVIINSNQSNKGYWKLHSQNGCVITPSNSLVQNPVKLVMSSDNVINKNCTGQTDDVDFFNNTVPFIGEKRRFIIDMTPIFNGAVPADLYKGQVTTAPITWQARVGNRFTPNTTIELAFNVHPYFSGIDFPSGNSYTLDSRKIEENGSNYFVGVSRVIFSLVGKFTPSTKISISASSLSGDFSMQEISSSGGAVISSIPYQIKVGYGGTETVLVRNGVMTPIVLNPIRDSNINGYLVIDYKVSENNQSLTSGRYRDYINLIAEIVL
ncbi:hypothetical protein ACSZMN_20945 [Aeromonas veronii]